jgi:hypothetical protein
MSTTIYGDYFYYRFAEPSSIGSYSIGAWVENTSLIEWYLVGSTDNSTWKLIDHVTTPNTALYNSTTYTLSQPTRSYEYIRLIFRACTNYNSGASYFYKGRFQVFNQDGNFITTTSERGASVNFDGGIIGDLATYSPNIETVRDNTPSLIALYGGTGFSYTGSVTTTLSPSNPNPPTSLSWVDRYNGNVSVSFTAGSDNGDAIINYSYSLNNGTSFTELNPAQATSPIIISGLDNRTDYTLVLKAINSGGLSAASAPLSFRYMCFLEGTKILCYDPESNQEIERPIESLRKGDLVKTFSNGYKPVDTIGTSKIYNPANSMRSLNRLYRCSKDNYPSLTEDLVITGCHSILVKDITDEERATLIDIQEKIYVTEKHYRLIAAADKKAVPYEQEGVFNIWHIALEHPQYTFNYGVYANGLLVETSSMRMMREMSGMNLIQ